MVAASWVRVTRVRPGKQRFRGGAVGAEYLDPVQAKPPLSDGLDHPVDLDQVTGAIDPCQRQAVQLSTGGPEPLGRGENIGQTRRVVDALRGLQEKLGGDRFR